MQLWSSDISDGERIPERFTCEGDDDWPSLEWDGVPEGTAELALICEDPDAPRGTFTHWVVWGLQPSATGIKTGELPTGAKQGTNGFGTIGYRGPCPPRGHGTHHYHFILYALAKPLAAVEGSSVDDLRAEIEGGVLAEASVVALYDRQA